MKIHYIGNKNQVISVLKEYASRQGITMVPYAPYTQSEGIQVLLLIEPINIKYAHYSIKDVWKNWLKKYAPKTKLIVAAHAISGGHQNFMSLLQLPESLPEFILNAQPLHYYQPIYTGTILKHNIKKETYSDPWNIQMPHSGELVGGLMEKFLKGHDKANSFFEQLTRLRRGMIDIKNELEKENNDNSLYRAQVKEFKHLMDRWYRYEPLMEFLPFSQEFKAIEQKLQLIQQLLQNDTWLKGEVKPEHQEIDNIQKILKEKIVPIVYAEDYY